MINEQITWRVLVVVLIIAFGCWFACGYAIVALNAPQDIILQWIRQVKCERMDSVQNDSQLYAQWCQPVPTDQLLKTSNELVTIWAAMGSLVSAGALISSLLPNILVPRLGLKYTIMFSNVISLIGAVLASISKSVASYELLMISRIMFGK